MIRMTDWSQARATRFERSESFFHGHKTHFIVSEKGARPSAQAFLLEQNPGFVVQAHFHDVPQFQVVARGGGFIGAHAVSAFAIHYTSAHSPYGPIIAGPEGIDYFSLRAVTNEGAYFMPESRGQLRRDLPTTQVTVGVPSSLAGGSPLSRSPLIEELIPPSQDGLAAWRMTMPREAALAAPGHPGGAGRFYLVADGGMKIGDRGLSRLGIAWVTSDDEPARIEAGPDGLDLLVMQFPGDALKYPL